MAFQDITSSTLTTYNPLFDTSILFPKGFWEPGWGSIYKGFFGSGSFASGGVASASFGPSPTAPFSTWSTGLDYANGSKWQDGVHVTFGEHVVLGAELRTAVVSNSINGSSSSLLGSNVIICGAQTTLTGVNITIAAPTITMSGTAILNGSPVLTQATDYDSDISLKKNIEPLQNSLNKVMELRGVSYEWDEKKISGSGYIREGKREFGFIAQEVESIFPDLVSNKDNTESSTKMLKYKNLIAVLAEAIKEQQYQIEELKQRVLELETLR